ncbi:MAG: hypothetical protein AUK54_04280 [Helicobacteraceae bacterium CG2_30_36_10]|nr:MAG: hypothetical protein AUK54_04280 [Helicobacteraceae bacterium CG2_30_36_10]
MLFFGHRFIESQDFYHVSDIESIKNTPPSSTIYLSFSEDNLDIIKHLQSNQLSFGLRALNIEQIMYASSLGASFIVVSEDLAKSAQNIANNYLFDAKILVKIKDEDEIEELAILGVDGVIFSNAIIKTNS